MKMSQTQKHISIVSDVPVDLEEWELVSVLFLTKRASSRSQKLPSFMALILLSLTKTTGMRLKKLLNELSSPAVLAPISKHRVATDIGHSCSIAVGYMGPGEWAFAWLEMNNAK